MCDEVMIAFPKIYIEMFTRKRYRFLDGTTLGHYTIETRLLKPEPPLEIRVEDLHASGAGMYDRHRGSIRVSWFIPFSLYEFVRREFASFLPLPALDTGVPQTEPQVFCRRFVKFYRYSKDLWREKRGNNYAEVNLRSARDALKKIYPDTKISQVRVSVWDGKVRFERAFQRWWRTWMNPNDGAVFEVGRHGISMVLDPYSGIKCRIPPLEAAPIQKMVQPQMWKVAEQLASHLFDELFLRGRVMKPQWARR